MQRLSEIALITQVVTFGSQRAFSQLVQAHQASVRRFLYRLTGGDKMRADDLAQETFVRAWQGLAGFRQLSGFETWLFSIAYRLFLDDQRRLARSPLTHAEEVEQECQATDVALPAERGNGSFALRHDLDQALSTLSEAERMCVVLQCVEGRSIKEITAITGMNINTVKSHLLRGKHNLAVYLSRNGYEESINQ